MGEYYLTILFELLFSPQSKFNLICILSFNFIGVFIILFLEKGDTFELFDGLNIYVSIVWMKTVCTKPFFFTLM